VSRRRPLAYAPRYAVQRLRDAAANQRWRAKGPRILALRHPQMLGRGYEGVLLPWLEANLPEVRSRIELQLLPGRIGDGSRYALCVPWLQDPVQRWSERSYAHANRLARACDRRGIPVINRVDQLVNAAKLEGSERIRSAGLRTPRMARLRDASDLSEKRLGIRLPVLVREDLGHGAPARRVRTDGQLARTKLSKYANPIAVEFVKVRNPFDKLVRKYRYVVAGDVGVPLSMHICRSWATKGKRHVVRRDLIEEERDFADRPVEGAARFIRATKALGLDIAAFDYGITAEGEMVVWEANPYPHILLSTGRGAYRVPPTVRALAAIARLYLRAATLPVPAKVDDMLDHPAVQVGV